jgi:phosphoglycolate phosphatase-like HAD superfamily hydrolase
VKVPGESANSGGSLPIVEYETWVFDCDGVLLDANRIKTDAFYEVAIPYGQCYARQLVEYHKEYGGISRYEKMAVFVEQILKKEPAQDEIDRLVEAYGVICRRKLLCCEETPLLGEFLRALPKSAKCYVVSGGRQDELRYVFRERGLDGFFDGIYGSPDSKIEILGRLDVLGLLRGSTVFIGDSRYDYIAAKTVNADFIFMSDFTEFKDWRMFFSDKRHRTVGNLSDLLPALRRSTILPGTAG